MRYKQNTLGDKMNRKYKRRKVVNKENDKVMGFIQFECSNLALITTNKRTKHKRATKTRFRQK